MNISRRDILKLAGGSALGMLFTPLPWKLLDDAAIWTQNWSLIPRLPRGPISSKYSTCTLCPGGCAIRARCVANVPVSLIGVATHPISQGVLCPMGIAGHHLAYHPLRVAQPMKFNGRALDSQLNPITFEDAIVHIARAISSSGRGEMVAILDQRPGRVISEIYREFLAALPNGIYINPPARECTTVTRLQEMIETDQEFGFDFESAPTVLNFGAPLLDGWGTPGRMVNIFKNRKATGPRLIQVESCQSRTALQADHWLPIRPGTESTFAFGIANVILAEGLFDRSIAKTAVDFDLYKEAVVEFTPETVAEITGLPKDDIMTAARETARNAPTIVIAGCDPGGGPLGKLAETAIAGLNLFLGNVGRKGGIVARRKCPGSTKQGIVSHQLNEVPDHSIRVLLLDGSESGYAFPWALIQQKLVPEHSVVVSLSSYLGGFAAHADYIIPSPAHLELIEDVPQSSDARVSTYSISQPLLPCREGTHDPLEVIKKLTEAINAGCTQTLSREELLRVRITAIHESHRGVVFSAADGSTKKTSDIGSADDLLTTISKGGVWMDDDIEQKPVKSFRLLGAPSRDRDRLRLQEVRRASGNLVLVPVGWKGAASGSHMSPILSKVFQESELRNLAGHAAINPATAVTCGVSDGDKASVRTSNGVMQIVVHVDSSVMQNVIRVVVGPLPNGAVDTSAEDGVLALCSLTDEGTWRVTSATIEKV